MAGTVAVREFGSEAEMRAHYAVIRRRCFDRPSMEREAECAAPIVRPTIDPEAFIPPAPVTPLDMVLVEPFTGRAFLRVVSELAAVTMTDLCSARRTKRVAEARQVFFWLSRHFTHLSLPQIGRMCGNRDHTTALHGCRKIDAWIAATGAIVPDDPMAAAKMLVAECVGGVQ